MRLKLDFGQPSICNKYLCVLKINKSTNQCNNKYMEPMLFFFSSLSFTIPSFIVIPPFSSQGSSFATSDYQK